MRRLNLTFLVVLIAIVALLGGGVRFLHDFQFKRRASSLLTIARSAEAENRLEKTEQLLKEYLKFRPKDGAAWRWLARVADERDWARVDQQNVFLVHEQALRYNPGDRDLMRQCVRLALAPELRRYADAKRHLSGLITEVSKDTRGQPAAAQLAELEELQGQCDQGLNRFDDAENSYVRAIDRDPKRASCYDRLARLRRERAASNSRGRQDNRADDR